MRGLMLLPVKKWMVDAAVATIAGRECNELLNPAVKKEITTDEQRPGSCFDQAREGGVDFAIGACL
jgi:hypothetical protein